MSIRSTHHIGVPAACLRAVLQKNITRGAWVFGRAGAVIPGKGEKRQERRLGVGYSGAGTPNVANNRWGVISCCVVEMVPYGRCSGTVNRPSIRLRLGRGIPA